MRVQPELCFLSSKQMEEKLSNFCFTRGSQSENTSVGTANAETRFSAPPSSVIYEEYKSARLNRPGGHIYPRCSPAHKNTTCTVNSLIHRPKFYPVLSISGILG